MTLNECRPGDRARGAAMVGRLAGLDHVDTANHPETPDWPTIVRLCADLGDVLADLPLARARTVILALAAAVDGVRAGLGRPGGLVDVLAVHQHVPDFLLTPAERKRALWDAFRAADAADQDAFAAWAIRQRRAAA